MPAGDRDPRAERPRRLAIARPMPVPPPVTTATWSLRRCGANIVAQSSVLRLRHVEHAVGERRGVREAVRGGPRGRVHRRHPRVGHPDGGRQSPPQADLRLSERHAASEVRPFEPRTLRRPAGARRLRRAAAARRRRHRLPPPAAPRRTGAGLGGGHRARRARRDGGMRIEALVRDVSERKRLEDQARDIYHQLLQAEKMAALGQTISGVAHELNNPLATILTWAERLSDVRSTIRPGAASRRSSASRSAPRKIVRNLLTFARKRHPTRAMVDLNRIVRKRSRSTSYEQRSRKSTSSKRSPPVSRPPSPIRTSSSRSCST